MKEFVDDATRLFRAVGCADAQRCSTGHMRGSHAGAGNGLVAASSMSRKCTRLAPQSCVRVRTAMAAKLLKPAGVSSTSPQARCDRTAAWLPVEVGHRGDSQHFVGTRPTNPSRSRLSLPAATTYVTPGCHRIADGPVESVVVGVSTIAVVCSRAAKAHVGDLDVQSRRRWR